MKFYQQRYQQQQIKSNGCRRRPPNSASWSRRPQPLRSI